MSLAFTTIALVFVTLLVSIYLGVRGIRAGERAATASERAATASEEELEIVKVDKSLAEERTRPRVDVQIRDVDAQKYGGGDEDEKDEPPALEDDCAVEIQSESRIEASGRYQYVVIGFFLSSLFTSRV